jgi:pimeloyl-ACP methyl ester carboxylesterase
MQLKTLKTRHADVPYLEGGSGEPLIYLHSAGGITAEDPLLNRLAQSRRVLAPFFPGFGGTEDCATLRDMLDFTLHSFDVIEALGVSKPLLVGHSMGGMVAAEMAAVCPNDVGRLALICPAGLWMDEHPIPDLFTIMPYQMPEYMFHDPVAGAAMMTAGRDTSDPEFLKAYLIQNARQLGMAGKLLFPVPERGLADRIHRIKAPTTIIWGESDRLIPPVYGEAFARKIAGAKLVTIKAAGHMAPVEQTEAVAAAILA